MEKLNSFHSVMSFNDILYAKSLEHCSDNGQHRIAIVYHQNWLIRGLGHREFNLAAELSGHSITRVTAEIWSAKRVGYIKLGIGALLNK